MEVTEKSVTFAALLELPLNYLVGCFSFQLDLKRNINFFPCVVC